VLRVDESNLPSPRRWFEGTLHSGLGRHKLVVNAIGYRFSLGHGTIQAEGLLGIGTIATVRLLFPVPLPKVTVLTGSRRLGILLGSWTDNGGLGT
jgi:hypothetical protein